MTFSALILPKNTHHRRWSINLWVTFVQRLIYRHVMSHYCRGKPSNYMRALFTLFKHNRGALQQITTRSLSIDACSRENITHTVVVVVVVVGIALKLAAMLETIPLLFGPFVARWRWYSYACPAGNTRALVRKHKQVNIGDGLLLSCFGLHSKIYLTVCWLLLTAPSEVATWGDCEDRWCKVVFPCQKRCSNHPASTPITLQRIQIIVADVPLKSTQVRW